MGLSVVVNGNSRVVDGIASGVSLADLVAALELRADRIAVELNGEIVPRDGRYEVAVKDGDRLEVVHFVGGGASAGRSIRH